jgi:integrase
MGLYIRGDRYYFKQQIKGKVYYRALGLKKGQEIFLSARIKQVENQILAEHYGIPYEKIEEISFLNYVKKYLESNRHKKSWPADKSRLLIVAETWGDIDLARIDKFQIQKLEKSLAKRKSGDEKLKPVTLNRYFQTLNHLFNQTIEDGYIKENPCRYYKSFVEDSTGRALSREELALILRSARKMQEEGETYIHRLMFDLILFALHTGMRLSEILHLKKSYIKNDVITYPLSETKYRRRGVKGKRKVKVMVLNRTALSLVKKQESADEYVFPIRRRHPSVIRKSVARIRKETGIEDFNFHQLRHTTSTLVSSVMGLAEARLVLQHADIKTTLRYTHPGIQAQREGVAKLDTELSDLEDLTSSNQDK